MKLYLYFNSNSGRFAHEKIAAIQQTVEASLGKIEVISALHELTHLQNAHIIAAGGDGTIHQIINHCDLSTNSFSFLAQGSGNDFYRNFGNTTIQHIIAAIKNNHIQYCDVLKINQHFAINVAGIGFEAVVAQKAIQNKWIPSALKYILPVIMNIFQYKGVQAHIKLDGFEYKGVVYLASCGNGQWAGGGFKLFPNGKPNDGKLDFLMIKPLHLLEKLLYMVLVIFGKHTKLNKVYYTQTEAIEINMDDKSAVYDADGEIYTAEKITIKIQKGCITVLQ